MKWIKERIINNQRLNLEDVIEKESSKYKILLDLKNTDQDPEWHSEGNVHIHTNMVIDEIYKIFKIYELSISEKYILLMSAIFHDIGKFKTSKWKEINGVQKLTAKGHEYEGMSYLTYKFMDEEMSSSEYETILDLVGYHQIPKLLIVKNEVSKWDFKLLTEKTPSKLFYLLELADMKGRECKDREDQIDYIELFKMEAIDNNCFYTVSNINEELKEYFKSNFNETDETSLNYLIGKTKKRLYDKDILDPAVIYQKYYEHKNNHGSLYIMCGLSGSGKSSFIKEIASKTKIDDIIELDNLRSKHKKKNNNRMEIEGKVRQESKELIKRALSEKKNVIFDACNLRKDFRDIVVELAESYYAETILVFVKTPFNECVKNDKERLIRNVGLDIITNQRKQFQYPERYETNRIYNF